MKADARLAALNDILAVAKRAPFYRARLDAAPLSSLEELAALPITTKEDVRRHSPFGLVTAPSEAWYDYYESFGTTGKPVSIWLTREDFGDTAREVARCGVELGPGDLVLVRFPYAISQIAHVFHAAAHRRGACVIPASSRSTISPFPRIIRMMAELGVTVLACLPLQALLLAETAELMNLKPGRDFPKLRAICTAGEPLLPPRRSQLEEMWQVPIFDIYGMTEIGTAAVDGPCGRMHPLTDDFLFEILREDLGAPAPPGEVGYLVITALRRRATPMIRYLTGDLACLVPERCSCGAEFTLELHGRKDDVVEVRGRTFDLWELEAMVAAVPDRRLWVAGPLENGAGLHFVAEAVNPGSLLSTVIERRHEREYGIQVRIDLVPIGTLHDRAVLQEVGTVGKPRYVYTAAEMAAQAYRHNAKS